MNIIRKIKLESLGYYQCKDIKEKETFEIIRNNFFNLKKVVLPNYNSIFWFKDDTLIFEHDLIFNMININKNLIIFDFSNY